MDLIKSLKEYVNTLENSGTLEVYQPLLNEGKVAVTITADSYGQLTVKPAETSEKDVKTLEIELENAQNELKEANKTINKQEKRIEELEHAHTTPEAISQEPNEPVTTRTRRTRRVTT